MRLTVKTFIESWRDVFPLALRMANLLEQKVVPDHGLGS
jgi:hypothetical protein